MPNDGDADYRTSDSSASRRVRNVDSQQSRFLYEQGTEAISAAPAAEAFCSKLPAKNGDAVPAQKSPIFQPHSSPKPLKQARRAIGLSEASRDIPSSNGRLGAQPGNTRQPLQVQVRAVSPLGARHNVGIRMLIGDARQANL